MEQTFFNLLKEMRDSQKEHLDVGFEDSQEKEHVEMSVGGDKFAKIYFPKNGNQITVVTMKHGDFVLSPEHSMALAMFIMMKNGHGEILISLLLEKLALTLLSAELNARDHNMVGAFGMN